MQLTSMLKGFIPVKGNPIFFQAIPSTANTLAFLFLLHPIKKLFSLFPALILIGAKLVGGFFQGYIGKWHWLSKALKK